MHQKRVQVLQKFKKLNAGKSYSDILQSTDRTALWLFTLGGSKLANRINMEDVKQAQKLVLAPTMNSFTVFMAFSILAPIGRHMLFRRSPMLGLTQNTNFMASITNSMLIVMVPTLLIRQRHRQLNKVDLNRIFDKYQLNDMEYKSLYERIMQSTDLDQLAL